MFLFRYSRDELFRVFQTRVYDFSSGVQCNLDIGMFNVPGAMERPGRYDCTEFILKVIKSECSSAVELLARYGRILKSSMIIDVELYSYFEIQETQVEYLLSQRTAELNPSRVFYDLHSLCF